MGQNQSGMGGGGEGREDKDKKKEKPKYEPPPRPTTRVGRKKRKAAGTSAAAKLPAVYPTSRCKLRLLRMQRTHDHLILEEEYVENQERLRKAKAAKEGNVAPGLEGSEDRLADERGRVDDMRGSPMGVGTLEEMIDDDHAIVSSTTGPEYYVSIMSFVDKDLLEPGTSVLLHHKSVSIVGVLTDDTDPLVSVMKLDKAPTESYADIGGLETQIQEVRESVELPLLHPELYEEMGIKPPKGVILYGAPGTGKTLLAKAVANQTSATFLRIVGSELIQKYLGDGPRLVRQLFQVAAENAPSIVFIDEIDAIGTKRYDSTSGGEREIQRTMLELLNQLDGFDDRGDVKVLMATNKIETLDPALIRPGRIDRKILFENPDQNTKRKIFTLHTSKMSLNDDVDLEEFISAKDDLSGADIKAICSEAGLMALRERRMRVQMADFRSARERVLRTKQESEPEEKRQRVLISARYDEALESVDNRLQEVLQTVTALQRDAQRQPAPAQGQNGLQRAADFPAGALQNVIPAPSATGEGFKGQPSLEAQVRQMAGTLGTVATYPSLPVSHSDAPAGPTVQQILNSCATPEVTPIEASRAQLRPFVEQRPEFASHTLPPSDAVLKMLRLAQGEKQRFFVDVGIFDEVEFAEMCKQVFFAIDPYTLTTWSIVNTGLFYMFLGLTPQRYHELGLQESEVRSIIGLLARNAGASVESFRVCSEPAVETCQALSLLGTFCMKSGQLAKAWRLVSAAARMCIDLGYHRMPVGVRGSLDSMKKWHIFWHIYVWEKGLAFTCGRASCIPDYDVSTERPRYPDDMPGIPGRTYTAMLELAMLEGEIQPQLFSASAANLSLETRTQKAGEFRVKVKRIQSELHQVWSATLRLVTRASCTHEH
ncbi:hypothetical protein ACHAQA_005856 [Verticillium albo-atrum]